MSSHPLSRQLRAVALRRLALLACEGGTVADPTVAAATILECANMAVSITNPQAVTVSVVEQLRWLRSEIHAARGGSRKTAPLFAGFPDALPDWDDGQWRFATAAARCRHLAVLTDADVAAAMDFSEFGWWPASSVDQHPVLDDLAKKAQELRLPDSATRWISVTIAPAGDVAAMLADWGRAVLNGPTQPAADVLADVDTVLDGFGVPDLDLARIPRIELRAKVTSRLFAAAMAGDRASDSALRSSALGPDDILRMLVASAGGDVSLATKVSFSKLPRRGRRLVLAMLEDSDRRSDVFRRRDLWLHLFKVLHPGEFSRTFPRAAQLAATLSRCRHDADSVMSRFEATLAAGDVVAAAKLAAEEAPGVLFRHFRRLYHAADPTSRPSVLEAAETSASRVPTRLVWNAMAAVRDNGASYPRLAFTLSGKALELPYTPGHLAVPQGDRDAALAGLTRALADHYGNRPFGGATTFWVDPACDAMLLCDDQRHASAHGKTLARGSRVRLGEFNVLRLFVHWTEPAGQRSDLDLSLLVLDEHLRLVSHVSYTRLAGDGMVHSGDITSAPQGASEFIDIPTQAIAAIATSGRARYLAPTVFRFAGPKFAQLPEATCGWMLREQADSSRRTFDVTTVDTAFPLTGAVSCASPMLYDIATGEMIWTDVYSRTPPGASVERSAVGTAAMLGAALQTPSFRPGLTEVVVSALSGRGARRVADRAQADITVGFDGCTFNVLDAQALLAEIL